MSSLLYSVALLEPRNFVLWRQFARLEAWECVTEFYLTSQVTRADVNKENPKLIYFQINSVASFLNTCTCIINPLNHQIKPKEMQTTSGVASVNVARPYPLTEKDTPLEVSQTSSKERQNWVWNCSHAWSYWSASSFNRIRDKGSNYEMFCYIYAYSFNVFRDTKEVIKKT